MHQIFLDEIIDKTGYILEEDSIYARKIKEKKRNLQDLDMNTIDCELATADVLMHNAIVPKDHVKDEMLSLDQLMARYSGELFEFYSFFSSPTLHFCSPSSLFSILFYFLCHSKSL